MLGDVVKMWVLRVMLMLGARRDWICGGGMGFEGGFAKVWYWVCGGVGDVVYV